MQNNFIESKEVKEEAHTGQQEHPLRRSTDIGCHALLWEGGQQVPGGWNRMVLTGKDLIRSMREGKRRRKPQSEALNPML